MKAIWWPEPTAGDIVWCHFPDDIHPKPKPRPALIIEVYDDDAPEFHVNVAYGTSQHTTTLHRGEFAILKASNQALPFNTSWFSIPPAAPHGQVPKLGTLHASLVPALQAAYGAAR